MADPFEAILKAPRATDPFEAIRSAPRASSAPPEDPAPAPPKQDVVVPSELPGVEVPGEARGGLPSIQQNTDNIGRALGNGMSFGLADKFAARMRAATGDVPSYDQGIEQERALSAANPAEGPGELLGGLITGMGLAKAGVTLAPRLKDAPLWLRALGFGAEGAGYGAAHGAGHTEGTPAQYLENAAEGAKAGAAIGAALPIAGATLAKGYELAAPWARRGVEGVKSGAARVLANALPENAAQRLAELGPEASVADVSPSMQGVAQGVVGGKSPQARDDVVNFFKARDEQTNRRLLDGLDRDLGPDQSPVALKNDIAAAKAAAIEPDLRAGYAGNVAVPAEVAQRPAVAGAVRQAADVAANEGRPLPMVVRDQAGNVVPGNAAEQFAAGSRARLDNAVGQLLGNGGQMATADQIVARRAAEAGPLYEAARAQPVELTQRMIDLLPRLRRAGAFDEAQRKMAIDGRPFDIGNVESWDYMSRALRDRVGTATRKGADNDARILGNLRSQMLDEVDASVPQWAQARRVFAGHSALNEALENGRGIWAPGQSREAVQRAFQDLTPGEQEMYRLGASNGLREQLAQAGDNANLPHRVYGSQAIRDKLEAIAPTPEAMAQFRGAVANEGQQFVQAMEPDARAWKRAYDVLNERATKAAGPEAEGLRQARDDLRQAISGNRDFQRALFKSDHYDRVSNAVDRGRQVFNRGEDNLVRSEDLAREWASMNPSERAALFKGARAKVGDTVRTQSNDLVGLKRTFGGEGDYARDNANLVFGEKPTQNILNDIDRNQTMRETYRLVHGGSQTQPRQQGTELINKASGMNVPVEASAFGSAAKAGLALTRLVFKGWTGVTQDATRNELARIITLPPEERDRVVSAVLEAAGASRAKADVIKRLIANQANVAGGAALAADPNRRGP